jgi:hypothetical protein
MWERKECMYIEAIADLAISEGLDTGNGTWEMSQWETIPFEPSTFCIHGKEDRSKGLDSPEKC